ncbi:2-octaprenylphenol hydroxylase [Carboxydocella thermautotrophica]|nr:2-octaprenylphenol hydroxylase [Carboxydocella thermautotrophica]
MYSRVDRTGEIAWKIANYLWRYRHLRELKAIGEVVRGLLQELGPTFIKLGQVASTRPDLLPEELCQQLRELQDQAGLMSPEEVKVQVQRGLGRSVEELFAYFDWQPLASASIAQVHFAILPSGEKVAVKIKRAGIERQINGDLVALERLLPYLQKVRVIQETLDSEQLYQQFRRIIRRELDFSAEGLAVEHFAFLYRECPWPVRLPRVFWEYSSKDVLTMEYIAGEKLSVLAEREEWEQRRQLARHWLGVFLYPLFNAGVFHADPHPGNILVDGEGKIVLLDFGAVGRFDQQFREQVAQLMVALWRQRTDEVVELTLKMGQPRGRVDFYRLFEDLACLLERTRGMGRGKISFGQIIQGMVGIAVNHQIRMPPPFFLLGKALLLAEGLAVQLDPEINILEVAEPLGRQALVREWQGWWQDLPRWWGEWQKLNRDLPRQMHVILEQLARGEMRFIFHHRNLQWLYDMLEVISSRLALSMIVAAITVGSALILHAGFGPKVFGYPVLGVSGFLVSTLFGAWMAMILLKKVK